MERFVIIAWDESSSVESSFSSSTSDSWVKSKTTLQRFEVIRGHSGSSSSSSSASSSLSTLSASIKELFVSEKKKKKLN